MSSRTSAIERKKLRAIAVNNKPQYYTSHDIAIALGILRALDAKYFDGRETQKNHLITALEYHLANRNNTSDTTVSPNSGFAQ